MSTAQISAEFLSAIALLIVFLLALSAFQKRSTRRRHAPSLFVNRAAPVARWLLGFLIVAYLLFIAFQFQHQAPPALK
jgi:heme/copper-type cytochrome/quinol oxidase subunit 2